MSKSLGEPESFVGVDVSEARLDVSVLPGDVGASFARDARGIARLVGKGKGQFESRVLALLASCPALEPVADALLAARRAVLAEVEHLDRVLLREARDNATCRGRSMGAGAPSMAEIAGKGGGQHPV